MSAAIPISDERFLPKQPVTGFLGERQNSDVNHSEPMTKGELAEIAEIRETMHQLATSVTLLTTLMQQQQTTHPSLRRPSIPAWVAAGVATLALIISISGSRWTSAGESELRTSIAVLSEKLTAADERQKERERIGDRERALIDERYRQMSIALESRGIKMPKQ